MQHGLFIYADMQVFCCYRQGLHHMAFTEGECKRQSK
jgi:hypothetical protein